MRRRYYQLDVFTRRPYRGNPLAVITDSEGLKTSQMQAIAREMNLSETVFVQKPTTNRALARLRIYTPAGEVPLAGHPVIGTWFLLAQLGVVPAREGAVHVQQQTAAGVLPVEVFFEYGEPRLVTMTQKPALFRPARLQRKDLAKMLGLRPADIAAQPPAEFVSTGIFNLLVPLTSVAALAQIDPDVGMLRKALGPDCGLAYCFATRGEQIRARGMLPRGLPEDPGTGSAAGSLGAYLVRHGKAQAGRTLRIVQGVEIDRLCEIYISILQNGSELTPKVSGAAVRVFEGHLEA